MGVIADKIRRAIFGGEVRDSIADGIEVVEQLREDYDNQVINAGNSNAEIVDARGGQTKLKDRLDNFDEQLDKNVYEMQTNRNSIVQLSTKVDSVVSGIPKGVYDTVEALKASFPTGSQGIYLVNNVGCWYYWN